MDIQRDHNMLGIARLWLKRRLVAVTLPNVVKPKAGCPDTDQAPSRKNANPKSNKKKHCLRTNTKPFLYLRSAVVDRYTSQNNPMPAA